MEFANSISRLRAVKGSKGVRVIVDTVYPPSEEEREALKSKGWRYTRGEGWWKAGDNRDALAVEAHSILPHAVIYIREPRSAQRVINNLTWWPGEFAISVPIGREDVTNGKRYIIFSRGELQDVFDLF